MKKQLFTLLLLALLAGCAAPAEPASPSLPADSPAPSSPSASATTTPAEDWWTGLTPSDLPEAVTPAEEVQAGSGEFYLLSELPEEDIALYGYGSGGLTGVLLRRGETLTHWEEPYLAPENPAAPELWWDDFDGDGDPELAVQYLTENTAQRRQVRFHLYSPSETGWEDRLLDLSAQSEAILSQITCSFASDSGLVVLSSGALSTSVWVEELPLLLPDDPLAAGELVFFRRSGTAITAVLPLSLALPGQAQPLTFASALCAVVPEGDALALELTGLESAYGV